MIRFFVLGLCVFTAMLSVAQPDTLLLPEFEKQEWRFRQLQDFLPSVESDSAALAFYQIGSVVDLLQNTLPLSVRNYGPAQSVSISNRGLAAAHTVVYWNGININSATTGLADFSLIPSAFIESMALTLGGSSAVMGSGPIGGGVHLNHRETDPEGLNATFTNSLTSTQNIESNLCLAIGSGKWTSQTNLLWQSAANKFSFVNHADREKPVEKRENSQMGQRGLTQSLSREFGRHKISLNLWGLETERQLPASLTAHYNEERQYDRNLKSVIQGDFSFNRIQSRFQIGFLHDLLQYENGSGVESDISTSEMLANADFTGHISAQWKLRWGTNNSWQRAFASGNYGQWENLIRNALYTGVNYRSANEFIEASVLLRYDRFNEYRDALSPSLALKLHPWSWMDWQFSGSRNYRIPGFNDRFWQPGGNPDLAPEDAYQISAGPEFVILDKSNQFISFSTFGYYNYIDNWIQWVPQGSFWGAVSYKTVHTSGLNAALRFRSAWGQFKINSRLNYVLTEAVNRHSDFAESLAGSQLPHTPRHKGTAQITGTWKTLGLYVDGSYTGRRFLSADNRKFMNPYYLFNGGISWSFRFSRLGAELTGRVHNLLNADYQVMPWMPMPLRTYSITLKINFTHQLKSES